MNGEAGKGDQYRPVNRNKWDEGWERIFGKKGREEPKGSSASDDTKKKKRKRP